MPRAVTLSVEASDGYLTTSQQVHVTVPANRRPIITDHIQPQALIAVGGADLTLQLDNYFRDPDGVDLSYTIQWEQGDPAKQYLQEIWYPHTQSGSSGLTMDSAFAYPVGSDPPWGVPSGARQVTTTKDVLTGNVRTPGTIQLPVETNSPILMREGYNLALPTRSTRGSFALLDTRGAYTASNIIADVSTSAQIKTTKALLLWWQASEFNQVRGGWYALKIGDFITIGQSNNFGTGVVNTNWASFVVQALPDQSKVATGRSADGHYTTYRGLYKIDVEQVDTSTTADFSDTVFPTSMLDIGQGDRQHHRYPKQRLSMIIPCSPGLSPLALCL